MSSEEINTSIRSIKKELDYLLSQKVLSKETYDMVWGQLHQHERSGTEYVEAIYRFEPQQDGDLELNPGDKVEVLEKCSPEWFKGKCNGKVGMFPSNYVKPAFSGSSDFSRPAAPAPPQYSEKAGAPVQYAQPSGGSYQQPYPPPSTGYYQQPPPQQMQQAPPMVVQQEQPHHHHSGLGKFGSKLGNAAIFGAGATLGSDLINSIF